MVALQIFDHRETELPPVGLIQVLNAESGEKMWVDTSSKALRDTYKKSWENRQKQLSNTFKKCGVDNVMIHTSQDYVKPLINLFKQR